MASSMGTQKVSLTGSNVTLAAAIAGSNYQGITDFYGKLAGSTVVVPHIGKVAGNASLSLSPSSGAWSEMTQVGYGSISVNNDGNVRGNLTTANGQYGQCELLFDVLTYAKRIKMVRNNASVQELRNAIKVLTPSYYGYGVGVNNGVVTNGVTVRIWNKTTSTWDAFGSNTASSSALITKDLTDLSNYIDDNGFLTIAAHGTYPSDGVNSSGSTVEYVKLTITFQSDVMLVKTNFTDYEANSVPVSSASADTIYTFDVVPQIIVFIKNDGPNDVYLSLGVPTGTAKKTMTLKSGEVLEDVPLTGFTTMFAKLTAAGSSTLRFKVVG